MQQLRRVDLRGNDIKELPIELLDLPNLERLDLRWNAQLVQPAWINELISRDCLVYF